MRNMREKIGFVLAVNGIEAIILIAIILFTNFNDTFLFSLIKDIMLFFDIIVETIFLIFYKRGE